MNNELTRKELIKKAMSEVGKISHTKSPRSKEFYKEFSKAGVKKRKENQKKREGGGVSNLI